MTKKQTAHNYHDMRQHIEALRKAGLLIEVDREINKDTEMHPLVRWQYRGGIPEENRKAWLFTNVVDSKGRKFDIPVLLCGLAGSPAIYEVGIGCSLEEVNAIWSAAIDKPLAPVVIESKDAVCHEIVYEGKDLLNGKGLDDLPVPISTPGWDNAPYTSSSHYITKDPETGVQNLGNYRGQIKAPDRFGMNTSTELRTGGYINWLAWKERGEKMPCAVVIGCSPVVSYASVQKVPEGIDELEVAGAIIGRPLELVKAKTVDLLVPADAEVVIEGYIDTEYLEPEAPFGESHGYVNLQEYNGYMDVTAITRKKDAIISSWVSQVAPSESSVIRRFAYESRNTSYLRDTLGIKNVITVKAHEPLTSLHRVHAIIFEKDTPRTEIWRAMYGLASFRQSEGKWIIAVNEDIDGENADALFWAMAYRCKPQHDVEIIKHQDSGHGPRDLDDPEDASVLIDATLNGTFPPVALPKQEFMERAAEIWDELGLPKLKRESPWYGYDLGEWTEEFEHMAELAVKSEYWETGKVIAQRRRNDVAMNTEVRSLKEDD
jgi:4-hydroxy-3-polyprenylbenzoate decarboxylase